MKIYKEIVLNKGENPKKNGRYLLVQFRADGSFAAPLTLITLSHTAGIPAKRTTVLALGRTRTTELTHGQN